MYKTNKSTAPQTKLHHRRQRGDALIIGIVAMCLLVAVGIGVFLLISSQKERPILTINPPKVSADDALTTGKSNNELILDVQILTAGAKRDKEQSDAAAKTLNDQPQAVDADDSAAVDGTDNSSVSGNATVEQSRLSQLQNKFGSECDRRVGVLKESLSLLSKLTQAQQAVLQPAINAEISAVNGLKTRAQTESSTDAFTVDKANLDKEYYNYLLVISQVKMLVWADDQAVLEDKFNKLGGKFQERLNDASSEGQSTSQTQITLNNYQAHKLNAKNATSVVLREVIAIKAGDYNANRAVLKTYLAKLVLARDELSAGVTNATAITLDIQKLKQ